MICSKCGKETKEDSNVCLYCGEEITSISKDVIDNGEKKQIDIKKYLQDKRIVIGIAIVLIFIIGLIGYKSIGHKVLNKYTECSSLAVQSVVYTKQGGYFTVKNVGDKVIKDFSVAYVGFDANGNNVKLGYNDIYQTVNFDSANIMPDSIYGLDRYINNLYSNDVAYIEIAIESVTYKDGEIWKANGIDVWAEQAVKNFNISDAKNKKENAKTKALLAENNEYLKIQYGNKYNDNRFSDSDDLDLRVTNVGSEVIKDCKILVMQYDENGYAITAGYGNFVMPNCKLASIDAGNLAPNTDYDFNWSLFFEPNCKSYKTLVYSVTFKDGSTWTNENALEWIIYNEDKR